MRFRLHSVRETHRVTEFAALALDVVRRRDRDDPIDDRRLRKALATGSWIKVTTGAFVPAAQWNALTPIERHRARVLEVARRLRNPAVLCLFAAAAVWDIDVLGPWPSTLDVLCPPASGGRSGGAIRRHPGDAARTETIAFGGNRVTTPAQTAVDLARTQPFANGVAAVDQAIWSGRDGGALTSITEITTLLDRNPDHPRYARALRAISFADPLAANVRETDSRVKIMRLGFPKPRLQERRVLRTGRLVFGDFYFEKYDHWGELDGLGKYRDPRYLDGRTPAEAVIEEKRRENEIRREVSGFSRWEPADATHPRRLYDILTGDGLPSSLPRP